MGNNATMLTLPALLQAQAQRYGDKPYLLFAEDDTQLTYAQLWEGCQQVAQRYQSLSLGHGDTVALLLPNIPGFVLAYWGAMTLGAIACPINTLLTAPEVAYIVNHCEATVLVTTPEFSAIVEQLQPLCPTLKHVVLNPLPPQPPCRGERDNGQLSGVRALVKIATATQDNNISTRFNMVSFSETSQSLIAPSPYPLPKGEGTIAQIIYTSGTTGKPKGVMLTHGNLLTNARMISQWFAWDDSTRLMNILPLFHVNGEVVTLFTPLFMGGSVVLNRRFKASTFWETIERYQVNAFSTVPTILSILLQQGLPTGGVPSSLQLGLCGAAPLPKEVHQQFETMFNVPIIEGYGLSETSCYSTFNPVSKPSLSPSGIPLLKGEGGVTVARRIGSIGVALPDNHVAIWNEHDQPVPAGVAGQVVVSGPNVMPGYFKNPEATQTAFAGGMFHTGDWGMQDADGYFYLLDRVKDLIIRGGENIAPREIDEVLYQHPAVLEAATIGVPHPMYGEEVKSYVVLKPTTPEQTPPTEAELIAFCAQQLAYFKQPKSIAFITEIPKGPTGKLLRRALRAL
jgi:acyl-CoA synthetase (AMP-forming)/AMP-acid ligase II